MRYLSGRRRLEAAESCVIWFFLYSVLGWLYEVFLEVVVYRWGFTNRGVLFGPYCPVYGVGALVFLLCFSRLMEKREPAWLRWVKPVLIFLGCMAVATAIELATSYILEAITGAWPWQTYRDYAINFEGRIALSPSVRFGLGGLLFLYVLQPLFRHLTGSLSPRLRRGASAGFAPGRALPPPGRVDERGGVSRCIWRRSAPRRWRRRTPARWSTTSARRRTAVFRDIWTR